LKGCLGVAVLVLFSVLLVAGPSVVMGVPQASTVSLLWEGDVFSTGAPVVSPVLTSGASYTIVAAQAWFYDNPNSLSADAQYYTTSSVDTWDWLNHFSVGPHSFLQINGHDLFWGAFSNGDTNHTYTLYYSGQGAAVTFRIVDWVDQNYSNNFCHLHVSIYGEGITVGGHVVDSSAPDAGRLLTVGVLLLASFATAPIIIRRRKT
jgi:hypothetical protein